MFTCLPVDYNNVYQGNVLSPHYIEEYGSRFWCAVPGTVLLGIVLIKVRLNDVTAASAATTTCAAFAIFSDYRMGNKTGQKLCAHSSVH